MKLSDFDYALPPHLIAQKPADPRDSSRLMIVNGGGFHHGIFSELPEFLVPGDLLVFNDSRVIPARIYGTKPTGGKIEVLLVSKLEDNYYQCLVKGKVSTGAGLFFNGGITGTITQKVESCSAYRYNIRFNCSGTLESHLKDIGYMPLPPYIKEYPDDDERYQTVYSRSEGSIAAPTAGLHFTLELFERLKNKGVQLAFITLHVGIGTFMPVRSEIIEKHVMEPEYFVINKDTADAVNQAITRHSRIFVVGTTTVRALESAGWSDGRIAPSEGWSECFIHPPYMFRTPMSGLITNFHLPGSTLLMLVSAFANREVIMDAYRAAIGCGYRFYSFGDAMLIMKGGTHV